jgi:hypothetical protein
VVFISGCSSQARRVDLAADEKAIRELWKKVNGQWKVAHDIAVNTAW